MSNKNRNQSVGLLFDIAYKASNLNNTVSHFYQIKIVGWVFFKKCYVLELRKNLVYKLLLRMSATNYSLFATKLSHLSDINTFFLLVSNCNANMIESWYTL